MLDSELVVLARNELNRQFHIDRLTVRVKRFKLPT